MTNSDEETSRRVAATANRLRMVQVDFADHSDAVRKEYLQEEIVRALSRIVPDQRKPFLEQLQEKFPTWDKIDFDPAAAGVRRSSFDEKELKDWTFLVEKLTALAPTLSEPDKQKVIDRLSAVGLAGSGKGGSWSPQFMSSIRSKLQIAPSEALDPVRATELLDLLAEFSAGLDQLAWNTWKTIAPNTGVRRTTPLQKILGRFAVGDPEVPKAVAAQDIGRLRRLIAAIISAVGQVGRMVAEDHVMQYSPVRIKDLVDAQGGGGMFGNSKVICWDQYVQMSSSRDLNGVEHEIMAAVAQYAETLMKGIGQ